ncbi:zinc ribbon domain-containing protein [Aciditerrimonas ferrireducens]|uniref:Zinc ribbon domain-containing protein n=1 Tax=Aciditerrimonas ferrireducens TaxID=667306 RepID=A0ABV6C5Z6_9ACTN
MPRYEYRCRACGERFELRRPMAEAEAPAPCPQGHEETSRVLSVFADLRARAETVGPPAGGCGPGCACAS